MKYLNSKPIGFVLKRFLTCLTLAGSLSATVLAWQYAIHLDNRAAQHKFIGIAQANSQKMSRRLDFALTLLYDLRGLLSADQALTRQKFEKFAAHIQLQQRYPGIHMLGYLPRINNTDKAAFEKNIRAEGLSQFRITSGPQAEYFPEIYIYPSKKVLFGNNLHARPDRGPIMDAARDIDLPRATAKTTLDTDPNKQAAFAIYLPVYRENMPLQTVAERRTALKGFVFETFLVDRLVNAAIGQASNQQFNLDLVDGSTPTAGRLLFNTDQLKDFGRHHPANRFMYSIPMEIGGRSWTLAFHPTETFYRMNKSSTPKIVLFGGLLISLLLAGLSLLLSARHCLKMEAEQTLSKQKQLLEKIIDTLPLSIFIKDADSRYLMANAHAVSAHGKTKNDFVGRSLFDIYPVEIAEKLCQLDRQVLASGETIAYEERVIRDGRECYVLSGKVALSVQDAPPMLLGYTVDITERKQMEEALRHARDELEERVKARTAELSKANAQLKALSLHLQHIREEERSRVAREIHDELGGVLAMIKFEFSSPVQAEQIDAIEERHHAAAQAVDAAIQSLRRIMADLRPSVLDDIGLWAALEWQADDFAKRHKVSCLFTLDGPEIDVAPYLATALFRMVQGALNNVAKHAHASDVFIAASVNDDAITVAIEDNGIGISDERLQNSNALGLLGRRELAQALGGSAETFRNAMGGTTVEINFPR